MAASIDVPPANSIVTNLVDIKDFEVYLGQSPW